MTITETSLPGVLLIEPRAFPDERGWFSESFRADRYAEAGMPPFVQDNQAFSKARVLRGLHLQHPQGQGKLVSVVSGAVFDVAVDVRAGSPTFGEWIGAELSDSNHRQLYIPVGFAHGYQVLTETAVFVYKCTDYYAPQAEMGVRWDDPDVGIVWPLLNPVVSAKDQALPFLRDIPTGELPPFEGGHGG